MNSRRDLVIYLSLLFSRVFGSLIYSKLFFRDYEVSLSHIDESSMNIATLSRLLKKISRRGANFDFKYEVNELFRSCSGKNYNCSIILFSDNKTKKMHKK